MNKMNKSTSESSVASNEKQITMSAQALASETGILAKSYARVSEAKGEHFNIFSILNMESDEEQRPCIKVFLLESHSIFFTLPSCT